MKKFFYTFLILLESFFATAQLKPIGSWTDHLPYRVGTSITTNGTSVFVGTETGLFSYNTSDGSLTRFSKVNLLNDVDISKVSYNTYNNSLLVIYKNGNIDLIKGGIVINIPFIKDKTSLTKKTVNDISFEKEIAIVSFDFGIVEINTEKNEISDSYLFGPNGTEIKVNTAIKYNGHFYAGTETGLYRASLNSNLLDYNSWNKLNIASGFNVNALNLLGNNLIIIIEESTDKVYTLNNNSLTLVLDLASEKFVSSYTDKQELLIITEKTVKSIHLNLSLNNNFNHNSYGIRGVTKTSNSSVFVLNSDQPLIEYINNTYSKSIRPNGPFDKSVFSLAAKDGVIWAAPGSITSTYNSSFNVGKIYRLEEGNWSSFVGANSPVLNGSYDISTIKIHPSNPSDVYFGSFGTGLYRYNGKTPFIKYDESNSSLTQRQDVVWDWTGVAGIDFDENENLWLTNSYTSTCLKARVNGNWLSFDLSREVAKGTASTQLIVAQNGYKWIVLPRDNAIVVYDDKGTITNSSDDRYIKLNSEEGKGNIPGIVGITIEEDKKGQIWVGTTDGIAVFFNPDNIFEVGSRDAQRVLLEGDENVEVLLAGTTIKDIAIDGANRKWIATEQAGVYLVSEDGTETIHHFTTENSPLFSNTVLTIAVDDLSGEVYFGTSNGIISYKGTATEGKENFSKVIVFPNPVRETYTGPIAISGLMDNSTVKITDISGNLINELRSIGGQAIWDGTTFKGRRASTGVYLIFNSAENEEQDLKTHIGKILLVN